MERPKFRIERAELDDFSALLPDKTEFVTPLETVNSILADSTDNKFLEAAIAGKANIIVSGDDHLLELKSFRKIPILTEREFIAWLGSQ